MSKILCLGIICLRTTVDIFNCSYISPVEFDTASNTHLYIPIIILSWRFLFFKDNRNNNELKKTEQTL